MRNQLAAIAITALLVIGTGAWGSTLHGRVTNGTTGSQVAGDEVILLAASANGMTELGRTRSDSAGRFDFSVTDTPQPLLIRVVHQGVTYHRTVPSAADAIVKVYDASSKMNGIIATSDVRTYEAAGETLRVHEAITLRNASNPPLTVMNDRTLEVRLPPGAEIDTVLAQAAAAQPLRETLVSGEIAGQYFFHYPIRPGDTRFGVSYHLPYKSGSTVNALFAYPVDQLILMSPKSMLLRPQGTNRSFEVSTDGEANLQSTTFVRAGELLTFSLSGSGVLQPRDPRRGQDKTETPRPGGGLGVPIDGPDPLDRYRWYILSMMVLALFAGGIYVTRNSRLGTRLGTQTSRTVRAG